MLIAVPIIVLKTHSLSAAGAWIAVTTQLKFVLRMIREWIYAL